MNNDTLEEKLAARVAEELAPIDVDSEYDRMINECYSFDSVGGPFTHMQPARVLQECDPIAYRCGFSDWLDGENLDEIGGEYYSRAEVDAIRDELEAEMEGGEDQ